MALRGNLRDFTITQLLNLINLAQKTGTLVVDNGRVKKQIVFKEGRILSSSSTDPREHLGAILVSHGFVTDAQLGQAVELQKANKVLLGKILVTISAISEGDLHRMLRFKAEESIYDTFTWPEGDFRFLDGEQPAPETIVPISLDVQVLVLEGMQRLDEARRIREAIPSLAAVPVVVGPFDQSELSELDGHVLALVDDDRTIEELCLASHTSEFHVSKTLVRQLQAGTIKLVRPRAQSCPVPEALALEPPTPPAISADLLLQEARQRLAKGELESALHHARAARALEPENRKAATGATQIEETVKGEVDKAPMKATEIPVLARSMDELSKLRLSPQEGFVVTRIDGTHDLASLCKIGPMPPLDMKLLFAKLLRDGHIQMKPARKTVPLPKAPPSGGR
jgi:hypothetical protein